MWSIGELLSFCLDKWTGKKTPKSGHNLPSEREPDEFQRHGLIFGWKETHSSSRTLRFRDGWDGRPGESHTSIPGKAPASDDDSGRPW